MMPGGFGRVLGSHVHENYGPVLGVPHDRVGDLGERMTTPIVSVDLLHSHVVLRPASYCGLRICTFFWDEHYGKIVLTPVVLRQARRHPLVVSGWPAQAIGSRRQRGTIREVGPPPVLVRPQLCETRGWPR